MSGTQVAVKNQEKGKKEVKLNSFFELKKFYCPMCGSKYEQKFTNKGIIKSCPNGCIR